MWQVKRYDSLIRNYVQSGMSVFVLCEEYSRRKNDSGKFEDWYE
jgi:poly(3-hydroxyalkanoate) synthetase